MKQILLLLLTFSGNCMVRGQVGNATAVTNDSIAGNAPVTSKASVKALPNPARHKAILEVRGFKKGTVHLRILNMKGELAREEQRFLYSGNEELVIMFSLEPGIYIVLLKQSDRSARNKLFVQ